MASEKVINIWAKNETASEEDISALEPHQVMYFLDKMMAVNVTHAQLETMGKLYKLSESKNVEISLRWFLLNMKNDYMYFRPLYFLFI